MVYDRVGSSVVSDGVDGVFNNYRVWQCGESSVWCMTVLIGSSSTVPDMVDGVFSNYSV